MTDNNHPITPPPELRQLWAQQAQRMNPRDPVVWQQHIATEAACWGADTELNECCKWLDKQTLCGHHELIPALRDARRPNPPSLKEEAMDTLHLIRDHLPADMYEKSFLIRRALEQLND